MTLNRAFKSKLNAINIECLLRSSVATRCQFQCMHCKYMICRQESAEADQPVFVHQSSWQRRKMLHYGSRICLIDATYSTTVYDMPLYMLCVPSNSGYVVVASFLTVDAQSKSVEAGLQTVARWCPEWQPACFMSDFNSAQISAIEAVFPSKWHCSLNTATTWSTVVSALFNAVSVAVTWSVYCNWLYYQILTVFLHLFTINRHPLKVPMKVALLLNGIFSVFIILPTVLQVAVQRCLPLRCLLPFMCCDGLSTRNVWQMCTSTRDCFSV